MQDTDLCEVITGLKQYKRYTRILKELENLIQAYDVESIKDMEFHYRTHVNKWNLLKMDNTYWTVFIDILSFKPLICS